MAGLQLGWRFPGGHLTGSDWSPVRRVFEDAQRVLSFPLVGVEFSGTETTPVDPVPLTVLQDESSLVRSDTIQCPQDAPAYLALGLSAGRLDVTGTGRRSFGWTINSGISRWIAIAHTETDASLRIHAVLSASLTPGDTLGLRSNSSVVGDELIEAEAWVVFLPLN